MMDSTWFLLSNDYEISNKCLPVSFVISFGGCLTEYGTVLYEQEQQ